MSVSRYEKFNLSICEKAKLIVYLFFTSLALIPLTIDYIVNNFLRNFHFIFSISIRLESNKANIFPKFRN
ncbi:MAG: hypothetical protein RMJ51_04590 [Candidatus Calescibacterium sp.]|nr:hypothetical protein [Candidatus Calescibacterium sp.]MDW8195496.1 hypothetical protein [Candidatus Calescibacterium sp.]